MRVCVYVCVYVHVCVCVLVDNLWEGVGALLSLDLVAAPLFTEQSCRPQPLFFKLLFIYVFVCSLVFFFFF